MHSLSDHLAQHIAGEVTTLATCWRILRRDGVALGFTTHDRDLFVDGVNYRAVSGFTASAVDSAADLSVDNLDIAGVLRHDGLTRDDALAGRYDDAAIEVFLIDWAAPLAGRLILRSGRMGDITVKDQDFTAELRGLAQALQNGVGETYSPECRADLGDGRCKIGLAAFTMLGTVTGLGDAASFSDSGRGEADGWFDYGRLVWLTGGNGGLLCEVKRFRGGVLTLFDEVPEAMALGDRYRLQAGCDKRFETCRVKFGNERNFRGEPYLPGQDAVFDYPGLG
jgi:uncharacterized phage protein (TIGR02218 family)